MTKFLCVGHTYNGIEAAIFHDNKLIKKVFEDKKRASKYFVTMLQSLLKDCNYTLDDLSFIAANKGPGPFTTLRVVLASCNGLGFATKKPLIGVDGLDAILQEFSSKKYKKTVALLDAYTSDVYFGISQLQDTQCQDTEYQKGCKNIFDFLQELKTVSGDNEIYFIGNGSKKYQKEIFSLFGQKAIFDETQDFIEHCSIEQIGKIAFEKWNKKEDITDQILPIYLKSMEII